MIYFITSLILAGISTGLGIYVIKENRPKKDKLKEKNILIPVDVWDQYLKEADGYMYLLGLSRIAQTKIPSFPAPVRINCSELNGEKICEQTMKKLFPGNTWNKVRPDWCTNPKTGCRLELDVYCQELHIAIEYNGQQHYEKNNYFHKSEKEFEDQIYRDIIKKKLCQENEVYLLIVPFWVEKDKIPDFIYCKLLQSL